MSPAPSDYIDVAERIREFREQYPEGSLQQVAWEIVNAGDAAFVVYTAAAYRTPDDPRPGHGTAWEPLPGKTNFTRDSELMNAETSAWGRAIIAVGAADAKRVASANEVANRQAAPAPARAPRQPAAPTAGPSAVRLPFGRAKGKVVTEADTADLEWILPKIDVNSPQYGDKNRELRDAIDFELVRRKAAAA